MWSEIVRSRKGSVQGFGENGALVARLSIQGVLQGISHSVQSD